MFKITFAKWFMTIKYSSNICQMLISLYQRLIKEELYKLQEAIIEQETLVHGWLFIVRQ